jgi:hypothetical protein
MTCRGYVYPVKKKTVLVFVEFIKNVNCVIGEGCCMSVCVACVGTSQYSEKHPYHTPQHNAPYTSQPTRLVLYLEPFLSDVEWWLRV